MRPFMRISKMASTCKECSARSSSRRGPGHGQVRSAVCEPPSSTADVFSVVFRCQKFNRGANGSFRKRRQGWLIVLSVLFDALLLAAQTTVTVARWPQDRTAAISLTFDDAMDSQLDRAGPILAKHRLHGTFFVSTGLGAWEKRNEEWKQLAKQGNELGNHTV